MVDSQRLARVLIALAVAVSLASSTLNARAQEPAETRLVEGQVVNGTQGGGSTSGLSVILHQDTGTAHEDLEATTDSEGRFRFERVEYDADTLYGLSVAYLGREYGVDVDISGPSTPHPLIVYDTTDADDAISVPTASVWYAEVDAASRSLLALEIVGITNGTDRTYVPGAEPMKLLRFRLPPGASDLTVDTLLNDGDVLPVDIGFALTSTVPPGDHQIAFSYVFPYSGDTVKVTKTFPYGAGNVRVIASREVALLSSPDLPGPETVSIGERPYQLLTADDFPRDHRVSIELTGLPQPTWAEGVRRRLGETRLEYAAPASLVLLMAVLIALALWKRGVRRPLAIGAKAEGAPGGARSVLLHELAELEERFGRGEVDEERYLRLQEDLTARVSEMSVGPASPDQST